jgi:hypothetical protein
MSSGPFEPCEITRRFQRWGAGYPHASDQRIPLAHVRLRRLAHQRLRSTPGQLELRSARAWLAPELSGEPLS